MDSDSDGDGWVDSEDCAPSDASISPDAEEICDGVDNDCDGLTDEDDVCAPAPTPGDPCTTGTGGVGMYTCDGACSYWTDWLGDDVCDAIFDCAETEWDGGDCSGDITLGVPSDAGDAVLDFQCAEWDGTLCTKPQVRIPDGACDVHEYSGMWADTTYTNTPETRICPSFCKGMTGDEDYITCEGAEESTALFMGYGYTISGSSPSPDCSSDTYRWWTATPGHPDVLPSWTPTITVGMPGWASTPQLNIECSAW